MQTTINSHLQLKIIAKTLHQDGISLAQGQALSRQQLNQRFTYAQTLLAQAGYTEALNFAGYQGQIYALYNPKRHCEQEAQRWLRQRYLEQQAPAL